MLLMHGWMQLNAHTRTHVWYCNISIVSVCELKGSRGFVDGKVSKFECRHLVVHVCVLSVQVLKGEREKERQRERLGRVQRKCEGSCFHYFMFL